MITLIILYIAASIPLIGFAMTMARILGRDSRAEEDGTLYCASEGDLSFALAKAIDDEFQSDRARSSAA